MQKSGVPNTGLFNCKEKEKANYPGEIDIYSV